MVSKQLDLVSTLENFSLEEVNKSATNIWNIMLKHRPKKASITHYKNGSVNVILYRSDTEEIPVCFSFSCNDSKLLSIISKYAENPEIKGKFSTKYNNNCQELSFNFKWM